MCNKSIRQWGVEPCVWGKVCREAIGDGGHEIRSCQGKEGIHNIVTEERKGNNKDVIGSRGLQDNNQIKSRIQKNVA